MDLSTTKYGRLKYTIRLADLVVLGAATSGDIPLDTLPPGAIIGSYLIKASAAVAGGSISNAQLRLKLNGTLIGPGAAVIFNTTGEMQFNTVNPGSLVSSNALVATATSVGGNLNAATAGQVDVVINYHTLGL